MPLTTTSTYPAIAIVWTTQQTSTTHTWQFQTYHSQPPPQPNILSFTPFQTIPQ